MAEGLTQRKYFLYPLHYKYSEWDRVPRDVMGMERGYSQDAVGGPQPAGASREGFLEEGMFELKSKV